jgi:hypothetical protein
VTDDKYEIAMKYTLKMDQMSRSGGWTYIKRAMLSNIEIHYGLSSLHQSRKHEKANPLTFVPLGDLLLAWYAVLHRAIMQAPLASTRMVACNNRHASA